MSGFVYALFDFRAGEEDEISFRAGERIDVLDKDDEYSDGWWRGRNRAGDIGIFPVNHTSPYKADIPTTPAGSSGAGASVRPAMSVRKQGHSGHLNSNSSNSTHTVRQHARAVSADRVDGSGSSGGGGAGGGGGGARPRLIRENTPARMSLPSMSSTSSFQARPSTPLGLGSSGASAGDTSKPLPLPTPPLMYAHPHGTGSIPASTGMHTPLSPGTPKSPSNMTLASLPLSPTATTGGEFPSDFMSMPMPSPQPSAPAAVVAAPAPAQAAVSAPVQQPKTPMSPVPKSALAAASAASNASIASTSSKDSTPVGTAISMQLPLTPSLFSLTGALTPPGLSPALPITPPHMPSARLADSACEPFSHAHHSSHSSSAALSSGAEDDDGEAEGEAMINHPGIPSTWTTDNVVSHLSRKGFDSAIQSAFLAHDISGDVLLGLDIKVMKEELGIVAYGKRVRLGKWIGELRRLEEEAGEMRERERERERFEELREEAHARAQAQARERERERAERERQRDSSASESGPAMGLEGDRTSVLLPEGPPPYTLG